MRRVCNIFRRLAGDRSGTTAVEYGFILALIVLAVIGAIQGLADATTSMWTNVSEKVQAAS